MESTSHTRSFGRGARDLERGHHAGKEPMYDRGSGSHRGPHVERDVRCSKSSRSEDNIVTIDQVPLQMVCVGDPPPLLPRETNEYGRARY